MAVPEDQLNKGPGGGFIGKLPYDQDMKAQVAGMDLPIIALNQAYYNAMAIGMEDARTAQRRATEAAQAAHVAAMADLRSQQAHQFAIMAAAGGSRQDTLSTTEQEQRTADKTLVEAGLPQRLADLGAGSANTMTLLQAVLAQLNELSVQNATIAQILSKVAQNTPPRGPEAPTASGGNP